MRVYRRGLLKLVYTVVSILVGDALMFALVWFFAKNNSTILVGAGTVLFIITLNIILGDLKNSVVIENGIVHFKEGKKVYSYPIAETVFQAKSIDNYDFTIVAKYQEKSKSFDCSYLSMNNFDDLLEDLRVLGDNQEAIILQTRKKQ